VGRVCSGSCILSVMNENDLAVASRDALLALITELQATLAAVGRHDCRPPVTDRRAGGSARRSWQSEGAQHQTGHPQTEAASGAEETRAGLGPPALDAAERSLRHLVTSRKISGGTQSELGTMSKMTLVSLLGTWHVRGLNPFDQCRLLLQSLSPAKFFDE